MKIKGGYIILIGIGFFALKIVLGNLFPMNLIVQSVGTAIELSWWIFLAIGIIVLLREKMGRKITSLHSTEVFKYQVGNTEKDKIPSQGLSKVPEVTSIGNQERIPMTQNMAEERLNRSSSNAGLGIDKTLRKIIIVGIVIIVPSIVFYFVYLPLKKEYEIKKCSEKATIPLRRTLEDILNEQQAKAQGTQWKAGAGQLNEPVFNKCLVDKGITK